MTNRQDNFPLGLDTFEILGASIVNLAVTNASIAAVRPDARLPARRDRPRPRRTGGVPHRARRRARSSRLLDGERTLRRVDSDQFADREELLTFLRSLYLLVETNLAELD